VGQASGGILALVGEMETVRGTKIRESNRQVSGDWLIQRRRKIIVSHKIKKRHYANVKKWELWKG